MLSLQPRLIRLFIIDPQPLIAAALSHLLEANEYLNVVGSAQSVKALTLRTVCPDVVLLGHAHGSSDICEMVAVCKESVPSTNVCVMSCHPHPEMLQRVIDAGAAGYMIKDAQPSELIEAIKMIAVGATYVDPRAGGLLLKMHGRTRRPGQINALSNREIQVVRLIAGGFRTKRSARHFRCRRKLSKTTLAESFPSCK